MSRTAWLDTATRGIRFGPDRAAVRAELEAHLEDKTADLERIFPDLSRGEAERLAVERMGDPEQIGKELARLHKPWLGWIWVACRWVLILAAVVLLSGGAIDRGYEAISAWSDSLDGRAIAEVLYGSKDPETLKDRDQDWDWEGRERLALYDLDREARLGEASLTLSQAALWQMEGGRDLYVQVGITYDRISDWNWKALLWYLQAEDSLGNHYGHQLTLREDGGASMHGLQCFGREVRWKGWTWNFCVEDLPEEAEWVRFSYALRPGVDLGFTVDLREEGGL